MVEVSSIIQERRKRIQQVQGTGGCLISMYGTAAVVWWEIGGGRFEEF